MTCWGNGYYHALGQAAFARCMGCIHNEYRPFEPGHKARYVAFRPEAIKCHEGIHTFSFPKKACKGWYYGGYHGFTSVAMLKSPRSKARSAILTCEWYEPKGNGYRVVEAAR